MHVVEVKFYRAKNVLMVALSVWSKFSNELNGRVDAGAACTKSQLQNSIVPRKRPQAMLRKVALLTDQVQTIIQLVGLRLQSNTWNDAGGGICLKQAIQALHSDCEET
jgi:hypothetical protein